MATVSEKKLIQTAYDCYECTVDNVEEMIEMMAQAVSCYAKSLTARVKNDAGYVDCLKNFNARYRTFFSNYRNVKANNTKRWGNGIEIQLEFIYRIGRVKLKMMEEETQKEVDRIAKLLFEPNMPKEAKILLAHNYLIYTVTYLKNWDDPLATSYTQSAYGALVEKKCVCQGFAEAYKRLMDAGGVDCTVVLGDIDKDKERPHAWNTVSLGTKETTYQVDVTWDNRDDKIPVFTHFCVPDKFFEETRAWNKSVTPICPAKKMVMPIARAYINGHREQLLKKGISPYILLCDEDKKLISLEEGHYISTVDNFEELLFMMSKAVESRIERLIVRVRDKTGYLECLNEFGARYRGKYPHYQRAISEKALTWGKGIELHFTFTYKN